VSQVNDYLEFNQTCFVPGTFSHGFTYSGHPVSCAVAIEALKIYKFVPLSSLENLSLELHF
jgi:adenosylmethionine-8-amino-7-oxononanoate aminotransferase